MKPSAQSPLVVVLDPDRQVERISRSMSSGRNGWPIAQVTRCWTSTSSGLLQRRAGFDVAGDRGIAGGGEFDQLDGMGRHAEHAGWSSRLVAGAAGTLEQAGDALRTADLDDLVDRRKIHTEVERRGADHTAQRAVAEAVLDLARAPRGRASRGAWRSSSSRHAGRIASSS